MSAIRLFIVDDHDVVREGLAVMLSTQSDFVVTGQASSGQAAIETLSASTDVDVVLLDLELGDTDGVAVLEALQAASVTIPVIVFTVFDTDDRIVGAVRAGARGYLLKSAPRNELFSAIRVVHGGGSLLQPVIATRLMDSMAASDSPTSLTDRELEVLQILAKGLPNKEIASVLSISERTVKFHVSSVLRKLDAGNRTEAVAIGVEQGLIERG